MKNQLASFLDYYRISYQNQSTQDILEDDIHTTAIYYGFDEEIIKNDIQKIREYIEPKHYDLKETKDFIQYVKNLPMLKINGIKLYLPFVQDFSSQVVTLTEYLNSKNISYAIKIAKLKRNDSCTLRVNNIEDAKDIIDFVKTHLKDSLGSCGPFIPTIDNIGVVKDYNQSFNQKMSFVMKEYLISKKTKIEREQIQESDFKKFFLEFIKKNKFQEIDQKIYSHAYLSYCLTEEEYMDYLSHDTMMENVSTGKGKHDVLEESLRILNEYINDEETMKHLLRCLTHGIYPPILKDFNKETKLASQKLRYLSSQDVIRDFQKWGKSEDMEQAISNIYHIITTTFSRQQLLHSSQISSIIDEALLKTYQKYGAIQAIGAMKRCIDEEFYDSIVRGEGTRENLKQLSPEQLRYYFQTKKEQDKIEKSIYEYLEDLLQKQEEKGKGQK